MIDPGTLVGALGALIVGGGGGAAIAVGITKFTGEKWLEARFAARLEALKHQQGREMEALRFRVAGLLDRSAKLNQREFDALPEIWSAIDEAFVTAATATAAFRMGVDLYNMNDDQAREFLEGTALPETRKKEIMAMDRLARSGAYSETSSQLESHTAMLRSQEAGEALRRGGLFISPDVYARLDDFLGKVRKAIRGHYMRTGLRVPDPENADIDWLQRNGGAAHEELLTFLRERFWKTEALVGEVFGVPDKST